MDRQYYHALAEQYRERRDFLVPILEEAGFRVYRPNGAYYVMTDVGHFGFPDDVKFAFHLVEKVGVATVPGSSFYSRPSLGSTKIRFCFPKKLETLQRAADRLRGFKGR
jgi:aminotransferase